MKRILAWLLCISILLGSCAQQNDSSLQALIDETAAVLLEQVPEPTPGSGSREWTVLGIARWGGGVPQGWFEGYEARLWEAVIQCGGVLHDRKYTEYSRVILAVTAMGGDAADFAGYDLTAPLEDFDQTIFQGINGAIYALLALDSGGYGSNAVREQYVAHILEKELPCGGWSMMGGEPEADLTAMVLQALAKYSSNQDVNAVLVRGMDILDEIEYASSESVSQAIVAFCELGQPEKGCVLLDKLLQYRTDDGMFRHAQEGDGDLLATEQAFYALVALKLAQDGGSLYRMQPDSPE